MRETRREGTMVSGPVWVAAGALEDRLVGVSAANAYTMTLKALLPGVEGLLAVFMRPPLLSAASCLFVCCDAPSAAAVSDAKAGTLLRTG